MPNRIVLVVEDDPNDEHLTLRAIRQSNVHCSVIVAHSAGEALNFLKRTGPFLNRCGANPTVIFVDNALPGYGGAEMVAEIRKDENLRAIPVIILSGSSDFNVVERCHRAGANSFLEKPLDMCDYVSYVGRAAQYWLNLNLLPPKTSDHISVL